MKGTNDYPSISLKYVIYVRIALRYLCVGGIFPYQANFVTILKRKDFDFLRKVKKCTLKLDLKKEIQ